MDPHADGLAEEPGCGVSMDVLQASIWIHTGSRSLWMPSQWTYCCTVTQLGCFTMDAQWEDLLMHSDFVNGIANNGLLKLLLLLLSFKIAPPAMVVNRVGCNKMVNHLRPFLSELIEGVVFMPLFTDILTFCGGQGRNMYHVKHI